MSKSTKQNKAASNSKPKFAKSKWTGIAPFTNDVILSVSDEYRAKNKAAKKADPENYKREYFFNLKKSDSETENMKEFGVTYYDVYLKDKDGNETLFSRRLEPFQSTSGCKPPSGSTNKGKFTSDLTIGTEILTLDESKLDEAVEKKCNLINKENKLDDEALKASIEKQKRIAKCEFVQWKTWSIINDELLAMLEDEDIQEEIGQVLSKSQTVKGFIQTDRKFDPTKDKKVKGQSAKDGVPLDFAIVRIKLKGSKDDGRLYFSVSEYQKGISDPMPVKIMGSGGNLVDLDTESIQSWFTYGSIVAGTERFSICSNSKGLFIHNTVPQLDVRRVSRRTAQRQMAESTKQAFDAYGDDGFQSTADELKEAKANQKENDEDSESDDDGEKVTRSKVPDSDDDEEPKPKSDKKSKKTVQPDSDEDDEPVKKPTKKGKAVSSDDEDEKPAKKSTKKVDSDNEDEKPTKKGKAVSSDDEDEKPAKKSTKKGKAADSDDEDEKPAKKPVKKGKAAAKEDSDEETFSKVEDSDEEPPKSKKGGKKS